MFENMEKEIHVVTLSAVFGMVLTAGAIEYVSMKDQALPSPTKYVEERIRYTSVVVDEQAQALAERSGITPAYQWAKRHVAAE